MAPEITVIIPTRNRVAILQESLDHLFHALGQTPAEVIVVNDGDKAVYSLQKFFPQLVFIDNPGSGVASARNTGARKAAAELLLFMDDDMWMTSEAIRGILSFHLSHHGAALNVNWIYPPEAEAALTASTFGRYLIHHQFTSLKGWNKDNATWQEGKLFVTNGITSQNLSLSKASFLATGGYNEKFPHAGFEDHEFSKRLHETGIVIYIDPTRMTFHNEADRMKLVPWMQRRQRGGETRKVAVDMGYKELKLDYSPMKAIVLSCIAALRPVLHAVAANRVVDRFKMLDAFSFLIFDALFATAIYKGYTKQNP